NKEGGTDDEEWRVAAVMDRVDTTLQVWMGLTMACAKCHNHKYDPITQKEYYQFFAFFNQTADANRMDDAPVLAVPTPLMEQENQRIDAQLAQLKKQFDAFTPEVIAGQAKWEADLRPPADWVVLHPISFRSEGGATLQKLPDGSLLAKGENPDHETYV